MGRLNRKQDDENCSRFCKIFLFVADFGVYVKIIEIIIMNELCVIMLSSCREKEEEMEIERERERDRESEKE